MTYIVQIIIIILLCSGCFLMYAECCDCDCCSSMDTTNELQISSAVKSPITEVIEL